MGGREGRAWGDQNRRGRAGGRESRLQTRGEGREEGQGEGEKARGREEISAGREQASDPRRREARAAEDGAGRAAGQSTVKTLYLAAVLRDLLPAGFLAGAAFLGAAAGGRGTKRSGW